MLHADVEAREVGLKMYDRLRPVSRIVPWNLLILDTKP